MRHHNFKTPDTTIYPHHPLLKVKISNNEHVISSLEPQKKKKPSSK
jgi:hypothetical protein